MYSFINASLSIFGIEQPSGYIGAAFNSPTDILWLIGIILIFVVFMVGSVCIILGWLRRMEIMMGKDAAKSIQNLTCTQKFILAASSPTIGNQYKCVIDIWDTHTSDTEVEKVKKLFEWGWGEFTYENVKNMADDCLNRGYNIKFKEYCSAAGQPSEAALKYTDFERQLLEKMKQKYPKQGMLAWDLVRVLSIVGGAYMGGVMEYGEAAKIALETCRLLQENFLSWDDMVGSYNLGYQFWRGKKKNDRLRYYKKLKRTWIYKISWNTVLKEDELGIL